MRNTELAMLQFVIGDVKPIHTNFEAQNRQRIVRLLHINERTKSDHGINSNLYSVFIYRTYARYLSMILICNPLHLRLIKQNDNILLLLRIINKHIMSISLFVNSLYCISLCERCFYREIK